MVQDDKENINAIVALGKMGKAVVPAVSTLIQVVKEQKEGMVHAVNALGELGGHAKDATPALVLFFNDSARDDGTRARFANALTEIVADTKEADPQWTKILSDRSNSDFERVSAMHVLTAAGENSTPVFIQISKDTTESAEVRAAAEKALNYLSKSSKEPNGRRFLPKWTIYLGSILR